MMSQQVHIASITSGALSAGHHLIADTISDETSEEDGDFDESDILNATVGDEITAQLVNAGPIGIAAAAAIATGKKRKRPHLFETNPSVRKRQQTRLLRKLRATIDEYTTRVGQQAVVLCCTPGKLQHTNSYRVFGSQPLENIVRGRRGDVMGDLETSLAQQAPQEPPDTGQHELPALQIDGIPTPVDKMTQAQLRAFIPEMLKYSTGRSKPGWGKPEYKPIWWPDDVAWANVRSDVRSEEQKKLVSWTTALRQIVKNCYKHHNRDDLLPDFQDDRPVSTVQAVSVHSVHYPQAPIVQTINNPDGTVSVIQIDTGEGGQAPQVITLADGTQAQVVHTVSQTQTGQSRAPRVIILSDGTQAQVVHTLPNGLQALHEQNVHTLADVASSHHEVSLQGSVDIGTNQGVHTLAEATINSEGQIVITGDPSTLAATGLVTIPVSMYQSVVTSLSQLNEGAHHQLEGTHHQLVEAGHHQLAAQPITQLDANQPTIQVIVPGGMDIHETMDDPGQEIADQVDTSMDDVEDIKPLVCVPEGYIDTEVLQHTGEVPDATQAVEVMSVDNS